MHALQKRLEILRLADSITEQAESICKKTINKFVTSENENKYTMLITHLAMAVTRMERSEELYPPPEEIMNEIYSSSCIEEADLRVKWIEREMDSTLPKEEREFLLMHFVTVLSA
jgi:transcriptional regulatory protein LevR